jgi:predicted lactoylglutathione lyase
MPQPLTFVTLGARDMASLRAFYRALGWQENEGSDDGFTSFTLGSVRLALYPIALLGAEAAPGEAVVEDGAWNGVTLAVNVADRAAVDEVFAAAVDAGARPVGAPTDREWGGYSGYIADPEGNRWEIAWAPGFLDADG